MVAKVFLLLLLVAAEYTTVLGNYRDINIRIRDCRYDCDEICSQPSIARGVVDCDWLIPDIGVARNCSNSCTKRCVARNSKQDDVIIVPLRSYRNNSVGYRNGKQETSASWSWSWSSNSSWRNDICLNNCNNECEENCIQLCVTKVIGRLGETLLYRNDKCEEKCSKDCSSSCNQKCVTRNSKVEVPFWPTYRNNSKQDTPDNRNVQWINRDDIYNTRNSTRQHSLRSDDACKENCWKDCGEGCATECYPTYHGDLLYGCIQQCSKACVNSCNDKCQLRDSKRQEVITRKNPRNDVCVENCNKECDESCIQQCVTWGSHNGADWFDVSRIFRNAACVEKCSKECYDSCSQQCTSRRNNRKPGCHFHDWCD